MLLDNLALGKTTRNYVAFLASHAYSSLYFHIKCVGTKDELQKTELHKTELHKTEYHIRPNATKTKVTKDRIYKRSITT